MVLTSMSPYQLLLYITNNEEEGDGESDKEVHINCPNFEVEEPALV